MRRTKVLGNSGEDIAAEFLRELGYEVIDRNWRCREGEVDVVAIDDGVLVVCEVKTRRGLRFGTPLEAVTAEKVARLRRLAQSYLRAYDLSVRGVRIDVVGVLVRPDQPV